MPDTTIIQGSVWRKDLPARTALKLFNRPVVRSILGRRHSRALLIHRPVLPRLELADAKIVAALERDGVYVTSLQTLGLTGRDVVTSKAANLAANFAAAARQQAASGVAFTIVPPQRVASYPEIYQFGLQDRLLDIAENYIGLPPAYDGVTINYTIADGKEISTRKWHRDWEDRRMLKVAIYLNDVDEASGPFQLIRRHDTMQNDTAGFEYELASDAALMERFGSNYADDIVSCCGPAGTVIFADTARFFHRGKPATRQDRMAVFYSYFADRPRHPFLCERTGMSRREIERLVEALPARQQGAALWRKRLSLPLRMIPPASL